MRRIGLILLLATATGCQQGDSGKASEPSAEQEMAAAQARYDPAEFDTIQWASDSVRLARGADIFRWACAECHGPAGRGDGHKVTPKGDTLRPPDFAAVNWRLAGDTITVRRKVATGNVLGMPHWGLRHMAPRDIDAVSAYVLEVLHPAR